MDSSPGRIRRIIRITSTIWVSGFSAAFGASCAEGGAGLAPTDAVTVASASAGSPAKLAYLVQPDNAIAGAAIAPAVRVAVEDAQGNVVTSSTASVAITIKKGTGAAGAQLLGMTTVAAVNGVATFPTVGVDLAGSGYVLLAGGATLPHVASNAFDVTTVPATVARLAWKVEPSSGTAGAALAPALQVALVDASGNVVTTAAATVTVSIEPGTGTAGASLRGTTSVAAVGGVATFADVAVNLAGSGYVLLAGTGTLAHVASTAFAVSGGTTSRTYTTRFPLTENPISEGGSWINGGATGLAWTNVSTTPGLAIGHQTGANYTDATALLTGAWGPNQRAQGTVYSVSPNDACAQEVELRLRSTLAPNVSSGYEISFKVSQTSQAYLIIVRWNGPYADFTYLFDRSGAQYGVKTGDVVSATIVGKLITAYKNGVVMGQATDDTFTSGSPGMGFNLDNGPQGCSGTNGNYGYSSYTATDGVGP